MPKALRAGLRTYWTTFGSGPRAALAIHCSLAHAGSWAGLAGRLGHRLTLTAFDLPGHGESGPWQDGMGEVQARSVAVAAELAAEAARGAGPVDVLGHSFGATVALRLAVEHPGLVRSLVLIEPVFFAVAFADDPGARARYAAQMAEYTRAWAAGDRAGAARAFIEVWGDGRPWDDLPRLHRAALARGIHLIDAAGPALLEDAGGLLAPGVLQAVDCPVLLIGGSTSPAITEAINEGLAARLGDAERSVIVGAGHMAPVTHPRQVASEVLRFLDRS